MTVTGTKRLLVREQEALELLGIGRTKFLNLVYSGKSRRSRLGARRYSVESLREWMRSQEGRADG